MQSTPGAGKISLIVPVLNEAADIEHFLSQFTDLFTDLFSGLSTELNVELILVDGGSTDDSLQLARAFDCQIISAPKGRSKQMNAGAAIASGELLLFLHADTILPQGFAQLLKNDFLPSPLSWGRFDVRLSGQGFMFRMIEWMMSQRSSLTGICTGDQAIFVRRSVFEMLGGFADQPLMEDIDISQRLKKISSAYRIKQPLLTSSRRWEEKGVLKTIMLMWYLRLLYFFGASPESLVVRYYAKPKPKPKQNPRPKEL